MIKIRGLLMKTKKLIFILMFIILFAGISCVSAVSENVMNYELHEIDSNNLIWLIVMKKNWV